MPMKSILLAGILSCFLAGCAPALHPDASDGTTRGVTERQGLRIASWNLEFLAEHNGAGCRPRTAADYAEMRRIASSLNADVIAFQEAENVTAARRVFDPARYVIVMEERPGAPGGDCGGDAPGQKFIRQAIGFAIRKDLPFMRAADLAALQLGNPNLRSGVDVTIKPRRGPPLRLLAIHLKSGCFAGTTGAVCPTLARQIPVLETWIDAAAGGPTRFMILGDWNRRLAQPGDPYWNALDDGAPANADLSLADAGATPSCDPRFDAFIDHIVLDRRAAKDFGAFTETIYATPAHASDHCPIVATMTR